jgi:predicted transposase/invertase (TIGR01784 family)
MARYLDPKNDLTFKRIFGEHPELLVKFLNAVMPFEQGRYIESITYLPSEMIPDNPTRKYSIVDVRCIDNADRQFIVEMQMYWDGAFTNRLVFNAGKAYVRQLERGENFHLLQPVYTLAILNENFDHKTDRFYHHYQIVNRENTDEVIPGLEFVLIELTDKFCPETMSDRKLAVLWLRFLKEVGEDMRILPPDLQANEDIRQAAELCEQGAFTSAELAAYEKYWDIIRTEKTLYYGALMKGEAIGLKKGEVNIFEKVVVNCQKAGYSIDNISVVTGLTAEKIIEMLKRHGLA